MESKAHVVAAGLVEPGLRRQKGLLFIAAGARPAKPST